MLTTFSLLIALVATQEFGHDFLQYYEMNPNYRNLNIGSYGLPPIPVLQNQTAWRSQIESCPDAWFRFNRTPSINNVQKQLAKYLNIDDWNDLVFTLNASHGENAVLRSIGDELYKQCVTGQSTKCKILYFNTAYGMVKNTLTFLTQLFGDQISMVEFTVTTEMLSNTTLLLHKLDSFLQVEDGLNKIYLSTVSHITSIPAVIFDIKSITKLMHKYNILTLIDGAHAIGQINVDIKDINPDMYLSNGHKWLFSPRGSSILYINKTLQDLIYPTCMSNEGIGNSQFQKYFNYQGTNDHTAWLSMAAAIQFREEICNGDQRVIDYIHNLCVNASDLLANKIWNSSDLLKDSKYYGAMINVEIPTQNMTKCKMLENMLWENEDNNSYYTWLPIYGWDNKCYSRISCQIYNQLSDYQWLGERVLSLLDKIQ
eukprot:80439_1